MKKIFCCLVLFLFIFQINNLEAKLNGPYKVLFSPHQGQEAFDEMYESISNAEDYVFLTIYSWSSRYLDQALKDAVDNGAKVRVVLHPPLAKKKSIKKIISELELYGVEIKISDMNMHEKMLIVDDKFLMNSSANVSSGAKSRYSENFVFHGFNKKSNKDDKLLLKEFKKEFYYLWNAATDIFTMGEDVTDFIELSIDNETGKDALFYSSSMNFSYKKSTAKFQNKGVYLRKKFLRTWIVTDEIISSIRNAKKTIYLSLTTHHLSNVVDELILASKRGVEIKLFADNKEYSGLYGGKTKTASFVRKWKNLPKNKNMNPPVRLKYYSHAPSPKYWRLNHHKFIIIDYTPSGKGTVLVTGSHNISKNAEHFQYDNMVVYKNKRYAPIYNRFYKEFNDAWNLGRTSQDKVPKKFMNKFLKSNKGKYLLHSKEAASFTWNEIKNFRRKVQDKTKVFQLLLYKFKDCYYWNAEREKFFGCPSTLK